MKGAIFYWSKFGSTAQYAKWIGEATGLPVFDIKNTSANPSDYDFLVLGSSIMFYKLKIRKWVKKNLSKIRGKKVILFSVSGAGESPKLDRWIEDSLPKDLLLSMQHVALLGRMNPANLPWGMQLIMKIGAWLNPDPKASKEEREGFDYVDKSSIQPILKLIRQLEKSEESKIQSQLQD